MYCFQYAENDWKGLYSASDESYWFGYVLEAALDDASHHRSECWHGPRVDDGVDAAIQDHHPERPHGHNFALKNHCAHAIREIADEESDNDQCESLRNIYVMSEKLWVGLDRFLVT